MLTGKHYWSTLKPFWKQKKMLHAHPFAMCILIGTCKCIHFASTLVRILWNFQFWSLFFCSFTLHCKQSEVGNWSFGDTSRWWVEGKSTLNACCYVIMQLKSNCWNNEFIIKQCKDRASKMRWKWLGKIFQKFLQIWM